MGSKRSKIFPALAVFIVSAIAFDRLIFIPLYLTYDAVYNASAVEKNNDIFVVGTSHLQNAIDLHTLKQDTGLETGGVLIPMSSLKVRYYAIKERLTNSHLNSPKLIILETSKYMFNKARYGDVSVLFMPYYHHGLFREAVSLESLPRSERILNALFHSYSFNFQFSQNAFDPTAIGRALLEKYGSEKTEERFRNWFNKSQIDPPQPIGIDPRIESWKKLALNNQSLNNEIDPDSLSYFRKIVDLVNEHRIAMVLLEPPIYRFADQIKSDDFENIRSILKETENQRIKHVEIDLHNNSLAFEDMGHLNRRYRIYYTRLLEQRLRSIKMLPESASLRIGSK